MPIESISEAGIIVASTFLGSLAMWLTRTPDIDNSWVKEKSVNLPIIKDKQDQMDRIRQLVGSQSQSSEPLNVPEWDLIPGAKYVKTFGANGESYWCDKCAKEIRVKFLRSGVNVYPICDDCFIHDVIEFDEKIGNTYDIGKEDKNAAFKDVL
jgi:hypothetical protein